MNRKTGKIKVILAAAITAAASLFGCAERIPEEAKQRMHAYQVHFDAILFYVFICNDDGLIGFYYEGEPLRYVRIRQKLKTGVWNAYKSEGDLILMRCGKVQTVRIGGDFSEWWDEHFADGAPVWIYDKEE